MGAFNYKTPVVAYLMDLPLISEHLDEIAPYLAVTASPWPGSVAIYDAPVDSGYGFNSYALGRAIVGVTETPLMSAPSGVIDRGAALRVRLASGQFESISRDTLLAGGNMIAVGDGSADNWELLKFQGADLVAPSTYELTMRLRGQRGTDGQMPDSWPVGSIVVALNGTPNKISMPSAQLGAERFYRIGPSVRPYDDPSFQLQTKTFAGAGLRPYAPAHLSVLQANDSLEFSWIRRSRRNGDDWGWGDVPLAEETENYQVQIVVSDTVIREDITSSPAWIYTQAEQTNDGASNGFEIRVAQISSRYGPGFAASLAVPE